MKRGLEKVFRSSPSCPAEPLPAQIDHDQLKQVFWNLATNAFEAMSRWRHPHDHHGVEASRGRRLPQLMSSKLGFRTVGKGFPNKISTKFSFRFLPQKKKGPGWGWPRSTASWICTADGSKSKVRSGPGHGLSCVSRSPSRPACGCGMKEGNRGKDFSRR